jgi:hypothetical protein
MSNIVADQSQKIANAADALVDATSFHTIVKWLVDNGFEESIRDYDSPLDAALGLLNHYKDLLEAAEIIRGAIAKV